MNADNREAAREQLDAVRKSEQMYRNFIERSNDGVVVLQDRFIRFVNPRFCEMSGYSADTLVDTVFTDYLTPEEIAILVRRYEKRMAGEDIPPIYETTMTRKDGSKIPLEISAAVIQFQDKPADLVLVRDITERKTAEEYLQRYRLLSETTGDMVMFIRLDGTVIEANRAAMEAHNFTREELPSVSIFDLVAEEQRDTIPEHIRQAQRESVTFESEHRRKDGTTFPVEVTACGAVIGDMPVILAIARDITERIRGKEAVERSLDEAERQRRRAEALQSIAEAGLSLPRLPDILDAMVETIAKALEADASCIFVLDETTHRFEAHAVYNVPGLLGCCVASDEGLIGRVATERRPILVLDADNDPLAYDSCEARTAAKSMLGVPMIARGRTVGVTRIQSLVTREFSRQDVRLLQALADRAAMAIDNARLYEDLQRSRRDTEEALETERNFSMLLQRALLPPLPSMGDEYNVAVRYVPVFVGREVGGDFYDVFRASNGWAGVMVGDVSGKGLEAASLAATTRSTIHAFVHEVRHTGEVLERANSVIYGQRPDVESFVTVCLITVDLITGELHYSSAGHPPAAVLRTDGKIEFLHLSDLPIGVVPRHTYGMASAHLDPGDKLLLYTDGISEAHTERGMLDIDGIERALTGHTEWSIEETVDRLIAAATEWADGKLKDDAAIVMVARMS